MSAVERTLAGECVPAPVVGAVAGVRIGLCQECVVDPAAIDDALPQGLTENVASDALAGAICDHSGGILGLEAGQLLALEGRVTV